MPPVAIFASFSRWPLQATSSYLSFVWAFWQPLAAGVVSVSNCLLDLFPRHCLPPAAAPHLEQKPEILLPDFFLWAFIRKNWAAPYSTLHMNSVSCQKRLKVLSLSSHHLVILGYSWNQTHFRDMWPSSSSIHKLNCCLWSPAGGAATCGDVYSKPGPHLKHFSPFYNHLMSPPLKSVSLTT